MCQQKRAQRERDREVFTWYFLCSCSYFGIFFESELWSKINALNQQRDRDASFYHRLASSSPVDTVDTKTYKIEEAF
jgi:hypothetical protein